MANPVNPAQSLAFSPIGTLGLEQLATTIGGRVTIVCGFPASGKTTATSVLSRLLSAVVLDKDQFAPRLEESVMAELTGNPYDRDSELYRRVVSPHLYLALIQQAFTIAERCPVVVDAPFLGYIRTAAQRGIRLADYVRSVADTSDIAIRTVWVDTDTDRIRGRMQRRGAERDEPKLSDWNSYRNTVLHSDLADAGPAVTDHIIAN
ncbi:AAA family ATPase [Nocardia sp. NPDC060259]|uniref:AAA family ATPase n=1 Tax=Nocardia sp. NPDC060259 TaxID=3347088 RepID=UPI003669C3E4